MENNVNEKAAIYARNYVSAVFNDYVRRGDVSEFDSLSAALFARDNPEPGIDLSGDSFVAIRYAVFYYAFRELENGGDYSAAIKALNSDPVILEKLTGDETLTGERIATAYRARQEPESEFLSSLFDNPDAESIRADIKRERAEFPRFVFDGIAAGDYSLGIPETLESAEKALNAARDNLNDYYGRADSVSLTETESKLSETLISYRTLFAELAFRAIETDSVSDSDLARIIEFNEDYGFVFSGDPSLFDIIETLGGPKVNAAYRNYVAGKNRAILSVSETLNAARDLTERLSRIEENIAPRINVPTLGELFRDVPLELSEFPIYGNDPRAPLSFYIPDPNGAGFIAGIIESETFAETIRRGNYAEFKTFPELAADLIAEYSALSVDSPDLNETIRVAILKAGEVSEYDPETIKRAVIKAREAFGIVA